MSRSAPGCAIDLACVSLEDRRLVVLIRDGAAGRASHLPWAAVEASRGLAERATRLAHESLGQAPAWCSQLAAYGDADEHPSSAPLSVAFIAIASAGTLAPPGHRWVDVDARLQLGARQRRMVPDAISALRDRMDLVPVAFRLLPSRFTLSQLQGAYEVLLGRRVPKASFRRALQGSSLIVATEEWTSEGRGRPAQLYRYAPRRGRRRKRPVRFEMLG
jgi:8-oxo-dGTP diphosphatase